MIYEKFFGRFLKDFWNQEVFFKKFLVLIRIMLSYQAKVPKKITKHKIILFKKLFHVLYHIRIDKSDFVIL